MRFRSWFERKRPKLPKSWGALAEDQRWHRFHDSAQSCACCGKSFDGVFDLGFDHPDNWPHGLFRECDKDELVVGQDWLSGDLCALGDFRFVRGLVEFPIINTEAKFAFGAWCSLKLENFDAYRRVFRTKAERELGPVFGWMCNALPSYEDSQNPLESEVTFRGENLRPTFSVHDESSRIGRDQENGITFDQLLDIYAASGNDIRPHLTVE